MSFYDVIVVGVGGMGAAACWRLARRGVRVLGLEQFEIGHDLGSSHGQSRIIRKAYFEHPDYVPLLHRAYDLWAELEAEERRVLRRHCGVLLAGPQNGTVIGGTRRSVQIHGLGIEGMSPAEMSRRFPGFAVPEEHAVLFEPGAGVLFVEPCVQAMAAEARRRGAELRQKTAVTAIQPGPIDVAVSCGNECFTAGTVVLTAGAWTSALLRDLAVPLEVWRKVQLWYDDPACDYHIDAGCPAFGFQTDAGEFVYGIPTIDSRGLKVAEHTGRHPAGDPGAVDRDLHPEDHQRVETLLRPYLTKAGWGLNSHSVCLYTMTPDEHFILGRHAHLPRMLIAAGFSGHGFKFAPLIGEALTDLAVDGRTSLPIEFLRLDRFGLAH
jgi:sarcosine oxidase